MHDIAVRRGVVIDRTPFSSPSGPARPLVQRQEADRSISGAHEDIVERLAPRAKRSRLRATPLQRSAVASIKPGADAAPSAHWAIRGTGGATAALRFEAPKVAFADARRKPNATTDKYVSLINRASIGALEAAVGVPVDPVRFQAYGACTAIAMTRSR